MSEQSDSNAVVPVVVILGDYQQSWYGACLAYTIRADGALEVHLAHGETVTFDDHDWLDVRMLRGS